MAGSSIKLRDRQGRVRKRRTPRRRDTALAACDLALSDETVRALVNDWIVPVLVERFLNDKEPLAELPEQEHN
jgi:hypothetical protein